MMQQSSRSSTISVASLLWQVIGAGIVAVVAAAILGGPTLGLAPQFSVDLVAPLICPGGGRLQYMAFHQSYQRPGESTPHVECWASDGTHRDDTVQAIFTFFGAVAAVVFVPVFLITFFSSLRQPANRRAQATQPVARVAASPPAFTTPSSTPTVIGQRLDMLEALSADGKITPQEYEQKRKEILARV
jgi:hypothetical protein